ncbi:MAG TPA: HEAT repeat domain-containing protein [Nitrospira sp.]|nr:HEAT repeat domain-containing protein [Nitrospira sp.]
MPATGATSPTKSPLTPLERQAISQYQAGEYHHVLQLLQNLPPGEEPGRELVRHVILSDLKLGKPEDAWKLYPRFVSANRSDDVKLLREVARAFIIVRVRDPQEHIRIAAYTALAEIGEPETLPILEDGLLDSSALVRARAGEAIGRAGLASRSQALKRALRDEAPGVRIAAINALSDAKVSAITEQLTDIARVDEGPESIFALAGLYKLGHIDMFTDIINAVTLPDPEVRMAAVGILGRLRRPSSISTLSQAVYDPHPAVRAFAAGALGEFGSSDGIAPLTHSIEDENPRVRAVAASSLGRLGAPDSRSILLPLLKDPDEHVRISAVEALLRLGDTSVILNAADLARHSDPSIRGGAAQALTVAKTPNALPILESLMKDQQPLPRLMAARALGRSSLPSLVTPLKTGLQDSDAAVRIAAAGSLLQVLSRKDKPGSAH